MRIGQGIDVHPFSAGRPLILAGVTIPHTHGLEGHSDADVVLHALTDALLGACGKEDIGSYFPNTDLRWRNAPSEIFVEKAMQFVLQEGWCVTNVDISILAEVPKVMPHSNAMKTNIARLLGIDVSDCAIKATTTEQLGFVGRKEGIMVFAMVLLQAAET